MHSDLQWRWLIELARSAVIRRASTSLACVVSIIEIMVDVNKRVNATRRDECVRTLIRSCMLIVGIGRSFYSPGKLISKATRSVFFVLVAAAIAAVAFRNSNDVQTRALMCTPNALYTQAAGYINVALPCLLTDVCPFTTLYVSTHAIQILNISAAAATTLCGVISIAQIQLKQNSVATNH